MNISNKIKNCRRCPLYKDMPEGCKPVPGIGPTNAKLMFVGEALGENESIMEEPFVGEAGKLLTKMIEKVGLARDEVYICNTVNCRPTESIIRYGKPAKKNRTPTKKEIDRCKSWLWQQIQLVQPKVVVTVGGIPTKTLLRLPLSRALTPLVGKVHEVDYMESKIVPSYHTSYLLQNGRDKLEQSIKTFDLARKIAYENI